VAIYCKTKRDNNGVCPNHNLQCGWPKCNEAPRSLKPQNWRSRISQYEPEAFDIVQPGIGALALVKNEQFALLIAAAPDLLEALIEVIETGFNVADTPTRKRARAAIAKATGGAV
jgi:hypothetical protein